jgi:hypothetical protein
MINIKEQAEKTYAQCYIDFLKKYLDSDPDALLWVMSYGMYCHAIDDIIDGDKNDSEFILKTFEFATIIYSNVFYLRHITTLYSLCKMASNTYMDSVLLEKEIAKNPGAMLTPENAWKLSCSDILRQNGNEVILAVVEIVGGIDKRREASLELRKISYATHHDKEGKPV